jgi:anti-sigma regulatory factor (Ser/Thr protein kinase)
MSVIAPNHTNTLDSSFTSPPRRSRTIAALFVPILLLTLAYGLLGLTLTHRATHAELMQRCVLTDNNLSRIWSVGNVEIGMSYFGVFGGMVWYFLGAYKRSITHLTDLAYAIAYLLVSFTLDVFCVRSFSPFVAMFIGDALVMTFTLAVSRQMWFQRLLGVFIPLIFLTCAVGHFLEGLSYWARTFPTNVPWTMVTADIGFAVLVNSNRFPAFIRGEDIVSQLDLEKERTNRLERLIAEREVVEKENARLHEQVQTTAAAQNKFMRDVLASVTEGHLRFCSSVEELPQPLPVTAMAHLALNAETLGEFREAIRIAGDAAWLPPSRLADLIMAAGEAAMNTVVHASGGEATIYVDSERNCVQVWIVDQGSGISLDQLPQATLERGFTTAGTLGHGFWMMLRTADQIYLQTSPAGTTIVVEQHQAPA